MPATLPSAIKGTNLNNSAGTTFLYERANRPKAATQSNNTNKGMTCDSGM